MAATQRFAAFLPDFNCILVASLCHVDPQLGERPLYPCVRKECACAGVFYKDHGGKASRLRLRVWVESTEAPSATQPSSSSSTSTSSTPTSAGVDHVSPVVAERIVALFRSRQPEVTLHYGGDTPAESIASPDTASFVEDSERLGGGVWEVTFRPTRITGETSLAQLEVVTGVNELWTPGFEVRTKPSNWLLLQKLPCDWDTAAVATFVAACGGSKAPSAIVVRDVGATAVDTRSGAGAVPEKGTAKVAFVRFGNRTEACGVLSGFKKLVKRRNGCKARGKQGAATPAGATPSAYYDVCVSLAASLNRMHEDNKALTDALVPAPIIQEVVQHQPRPAYLPDVSAPVAAPAPTTVSPIVESVLCKRGAPVDDDDNSSDVTAAKRRCTETRVPVPVVASDDEEWDTCDSEEDDIVMPVAVDVSDRDVSVRPPSPPCVDAVVLPSPLCAMSKVPTPVTSVMPPTTVAPPSPLVNLCDTMLDDTLPSPLATLDDDQLMESWSMLPGVDSSIVDMLATM